MFGQSYQSAPAWRNHVCGLYYCIPHQGQLHKLYLPQVELHAHATILSTTSRTVLKQTFLNPSSTKGIKEVKYTFPLYDGVSVVGFTCHVGDRVIVGEVKEKEKAKQVYTAAVARGETAGLFEQLDTSDVFQTTVGNIPPDARVIVELTYLGELKHDMEVDGIRFTIPNIIAPRYGRYPPGYNSQQATARSISITVDAEMAEGSFIQKILSPSHPISVSMGTTSIAPNAEPTMTKASATLSLGTTELGNDFVLQLVAKDTGVPKAVLETHPTIPNQRALMVTLVPKFALPPERPEIVFVCDRSGSMQGNNIALVRQALQVFLKSLPVGVMFNICSFGSGYSFLWDRSKAYSEETLNEAVRHVNTFDANYGGTEMLQPLTATIEKRYKDIPLEVMLLTDGAIWNQDSLFSYLNGQVANAKVPIRVYSLGVGAGVSYALVEGIARAGNGFSQTVGEGEKMDAKVVRMLKGALSPHVNDYRLEIRYGDNSKEREKDGGFEIVEKVADSLRVNLSLSEKEEKPVPEKPISLFDTSVNPDKEETPVSDQTGESRCSHLPKLPVPHIIQTPQHIPTLFAFNRTTIYLLLGPESPQQTPTSVTLRGTSTHGPLELEFPVQVLETSSEMVHQLAAKKAISELEAGRGWLPEARDESGQLVKDRYESRFGSMVEREAVRLGVQFQVGGKWCSFVAVEKKENPTRDQTRDQEMGGWELLEDEGLGHPTLFSNPGMASKSGGLFDGLTGGLFGGRSGGLFGNSSGGRPEMKTSKRSASRSSDQSAVARPTPSVDGVSLGARALQDYQMQLMMCEQQNKKRLLMKRQEADTYGSQSGPVQQGPVRPMAMQMQQQQMQPQMCSSAAPRQVGPQGAAFGNLTTPPASGTNVGTVEFSRSEGFGGDALENFDFDSFLHVDDKSPGGFGAAGGDLGFEPPLASLDSPAYSPASPGYSPVSPARAPSYTAMSPAPPNAEISGTLSVTNNSFGGAFGASNNATGGVPLGGASRKSSGGLFGASKSPCGGLFGASKSPSGGLFGALKPSSGGLFGASKSSSGGSLFGAPSNTSPPNATAGVSLFGGVPPPPPPPPPGGFGSAFGSAPTGATGAQAPNPFAGTSSRLSGSKAKTPTEPGEILAFLIGAQKFEGSWAWDPAVLAVMRISEEGARSTRSEMAVDEAEWVTALVIAYFEERLESERGSWELVVDKAKHWLVGRLGDEKVNKLVAKAKELV